MRIKEWRERWNGWTGKFKKNLREEQKRANNE